MKMPVTIGEKGLEKFINEWVIVGLDHKAVSDTSWGMENRFGFKGPLRRDEKTFYVEIYEGEGTREYPLRATKRIRRIWSGDSIIVNQKGWQREYVVEVKYEKPQQTINDKMGVVE